MEQKKIGIVILATNAYFVLGVRFIKKFMHHYQGESKIKFYFFSDDDPSDCIPENIDVTFIKESHTDWVSATNSKFKDIVQIKEQLLNEVDYVYYFDADTNISRPFTEEWFLGDLVGGEHYGNKSFLSDGKGFDRNPIGHSYVPLDSPLPYTYHYGAFFGGTTENIIKFCETLTQYQIEDQAKGYEPPVNDESYINAYFHYNPPYSVPCEKFAFDISDKGGLGETRNTKLDVSILKQQVQKNKYKLFNISNNELVLQTGKVTIYTTHYNKPEFVQLQYEHLKKWCTDDFEYVVINNGIDEDTAQKISSECNDIKQITIHQDNRQQYCSYDHIKCLEVVYKEHISKDTNSEIRVVMDSDIFPFKEFSFYDIIQNHDMCGLYYDGGHEYCAAIFTAYSKKIDLEGFEICGGFGDSGSGTKNLISKYKNRWIKHTAPIKQEEIPYIFKPNTLYKPEYGFHFIEESLVHYYRGSGWDTQHIGQDYHTQKFNCLTDLLSNPDKYILGFPANVNYEYALLEQYGRPDKYRLNKKRILILVMSSQIHMSRRDAIIGSYAKRVKDYSNIDLIFYSDDEDPATNTIKVDVPLQMKYSDNEIKTVGAIDLIEKRYHNKYNWYLFVDDDTFINIPLLNEKINMFDEDFVHGRDITGCMGELEYVSGGAGILMSNKVVEKLFKMVCYNTEFSDINVGMNLKDRNIKIRNSNLFNPSNPYRDNATDNLEEDVKNNITQHYLYPSMMKEFDDMIS